MPDSSNAYEQRPADRPQLPEELRAAIERCNAALRLANEEACLVVHLLGVGRGVRPDDDYVAASAELPWHREVIGSVGAALDAIERETGVPAAPAQESRR